MAAAVDPSASAPFAYEVEPDRDRVIVRLRGEFDLLAVPDIEQVVGELVEVGFRQIVMDLRGLTFMDSSGLRSLLSAHRSLRASGGSLVLMRGGKPVERLLELTGAESLFTVEAARARP